MLTHVGLLAALRRAARYHEIRDDDLNGLVVLVERRRSHLDQSLIWTGPRGPHLEDLALDPQLIPGSHGSWPAELVSPGAHDAARGVEGALHQEPHGDRGRAHHRRPVRGRSCRARPPPPDGTAAGRTRRPMSRVAPCRTPPRPS